MISLKTDGLLIEFQVSLLIAVCWWLMQMAWYNSSDKQGAQPNMTTPQDQASGAYMFRPNGLITSTSPVVVQIVEGPVLTEVRQVGGPL